MRRPFVLIVGLSLGACSSSDANVQADVEAPGDADGREVGDGGGPDVGDAETSAGDGAVIDAEAGAPCTFNRECPAADRCECIDFDCRCRPGARGTGKNGVDTCTMGEDCASSICAEGSDGKSYCSDECTSDATCGGALPRCIDVAGIGKICARTP